MFISARRLNPIQNPRREKLLFEEGRGENCTRRVLYDCVHTEALLQKQVSSWVPTEDERAIRTRAVMTVLLVTLQDIVFNNLYDVVPIYGARFFDYPRIVSSFHQLTPLHVNQNYFPRIMVKLLAALLIS